ncbi:E3 ubiquitin-protein ligase TRIM37-like [Wyeomyia smithii]|uniref:E3 ubiquitin-protein ligase TRIM37-like n=1 Tax=Wyeomyia smithii TaxID=174621 RepID=UPI0024680233|nr:E3 ubiquitin-protein ligase TRIM37-like [Wyeomyia smithii]
MENRLEELEVMSFFECCICQRNLKDAQLCPHCSKMFCRTCIFTWFEKDKSCPCCRIHIDESSLVKGRSIEDMQIMFEKFHILDERNRCKKHKTRELSLFCIICEESICTNCWNMEPHLEHKEQTVPVDEACNQYQGQLKSDLLWLEECNASKQFLLKKIENYETLLTDELKLMQDKLEQMTNAGVQHFEQQLKIQKTAKDSLQDNIEKTADLCNQWSILLKAENNANVLHQLMEAKKTVDSKRLEQDPNRNIVEPSYKNDVAPEPTELLFHMKQFNEVISEHKFYESQQNCHSFQWMLRLESVNEKSICYLRLMKGFPGEYWVALNTKQPQRLQFAEGASVELGELDPTIGDDDSLKVLVRIRHWETFAQKCAQLEEYVKQLERENAENKSILGVLADWQSKNSC